MENTLKNAFDKVKGKSLSAATVLGTTFTAMYMNTVVAHADILDNMAKSMKTYYGKFVAFSTALALFLIVIGVLWIMLAPSSKGAATPLAWIRKIVIAWVVIQCLGGLLAVANDVIKGNDNGADDAAWNISTSANYRPDDMPNKLKDYDISYNV